MDQGSSRSEVGDWGFRVHLYIFIIKCVTHNSCLMSAWVSAE